MEPLGRLELEGRGCLLGALWGWARGSTLAIASSWARSRTVGSVAWVRLWTLPRKLAV